MRIKKIFLSLLISLMFVIPSICLSASVELWELFPIDRGANYAYPLAYRVETGTLRLLDKLGDYSFGTPGNPWNIPYILRGNDQWIITHPKGWEIGDGRYTEATILALVIPQDVSSVDRITGTIDPWDGGDVSFKMGTLFQGILYETNVGYSPVNFDFSTHINAGDIAWFGVFPNGGSSNDTTYYKTTIFYTPIPAPPTIILMITGVGAFIFLRKKIKRE